MIDQILGLVNKIYNLPDLIGWGSYWILFLIIFAETGLFVGFFLPGDSLLIAAGLFAAAGKLNIYFLIGLLAAAAIIGDSTGYYFGERVGRRLFERKKSRFFKPRHLLKAKDFYDRHGGKTIIIARFMPVVRTFAPIVAGAAEMPYRRFLSFNIIGGVFWVASLTLIGYFIGSVIPDIDRYMGILILTIIVLSIIPGGVGYLKEKRKDEKPIPLPV